MSSYFLLQLALTIGLLVLIAFVIFVLAQVYRTLRRFEDLLTNLNEDLPSVLSKLQMTLDGVNSEIDCVEQLVAVFEEVSAGVQSTTGFVRRAVSSPFIRVAGFASGAGAALSRLARREKNND